MPKSPRSLGAECLADRRPTGLEVSWSQWTAGFLPVGLLLLLPLPLLVYALYPPEIRSSPEVSTWAKQELARMGRLSSKEALFGFFILVAFSLWLFAGKWINPTTVILGVIALLVLSRILDWDDVVGNRLAWDTLVYFAALLALAEGLEQVGIVAWAAQVASTFLVGASPILAIIVLVSFFFLIHYFFASLTAHTMAVLPALLAAGIAFPGMPMRHSRSFSLCNRPHGRDHPLRHRPSPGLLRKRLHSAQRFLDSRVCFRSDLSDCVTGRRHSVLAGTSVVMGERLVCNQEVAGSIPVVST